MTLWYLLTGISGLVPLIVGVQAGFQAGWCGGIIGSVVGTVFGIATAIAIEIVHRKLTFGASPDSKADGYLVQNSACSLCYFGILGCGMLSAMLTQIIVAKLISLMA